MLKCLSKGSILDTTSISSIHPGAHSLLYNDHHIRLFNTPWGPQPSIQRSPHPSLQYTPGPTAFYTTTTTSISSIHSGAHSLLYNDHHIRLFNTPRGPQPSIQRWLKLTTNLHLLPWSRTVELYLHSSIRLHSVEIRDNFTFTKHLCHSDDWTIAFISRAVLSESRVRPMCYVSSLRAIKFVHPARNSLESTEGKHCFVFPSLAVRIMKTNIVWVMLSKTRKHSR
jgi:hypothetical protein